MTKTTPKEVFRLAARHAGYIANGITQFTLKELAALIDEVRGVDAEPALIDMDRVEDLINQWAQDWHDWQTSGKEQDRLHWLDSRRDVIAYFQQTCTPQPAPDAQPVAPSTLTAEDLQEICESDEMLREIGAMCANQGMFVGSYADIVRQALAASAPEQQAGQMSREPTTFMTRDAFAKAALPGTGSEKEPSVPQIVQDIMILMMPYVRAVVAFNSAEGEKIEPASANVHAAFKPLEAALTALVSERDQLKFELDGVNARRLPPSYNGSTLTSDADRAAKITFYFDDVAEAETWHETVIASHSIEPEQGEAKS